MSTRAAPAVATPARSGPARLTASLGIEIALLAAMLAVAVAVRLVGLGEPTDVSDEGIRGIQLRLLAAGYLPVSEIYASQGPLSLWLFAPAVALFGSDILVGRLTSVGASLVALAGTVWIARQQAGRVAGVAAGLVMALAPVYLDSSRLAFVEAPSLAPTVLSLGLLLHMRRGGRRWGLVVAGVLMAVGALAKPMAAVAGLPALILLLAPRVGAASGLVRADTIRRRIADLVLFGLTGLVVCVLVVVAIGPQVVYEQVIAYRLGARAARGWDFAGNEALVFEQLRLNSWGVSLAAVAGVVLALVRRQVLGLAMVAWLLGGLAALLVYSPLWPKHLSYVMPPLAILAGGGIASVGALTARPLRWQRAALALPGIFAVALLAWQMPLLVDQTRSIVYRHAGADLTRYADDILIVQTATAPSDFVVIDDAYLSMLTGRLTPPPLADLSWNRILARALTAEQAIAETRRFDSRILILQDDHLGQAQRYLAWADREFVLVKTYVQRRPARFRRVYASPSVDLAAVKDVLQASLANPTDARLGPAAVLGYELDSRVVKPGSRLDLTLMFEALQDRPPEHALIVRLHDRAGATAWEGEWKVGDGSQELHTWKAGGWQVQTMRLLIDDEVTDGEYHLTIALHRPNIGPASVRVRSGAAVSASGGEIDLGPVTVAR